LVQDQGAIKPPGVTACVWAATRENADAIGCGTLR